MSTSQAIQAQAIYEPQLLQKENVVGVAVGFKESKGEKTGELSVVVLVEQKKPLAALSAEDVIPPELDGMRTDVYEVGYLRALQTQNPKGRFRPIIPPGVRIGHYKITAGTFGALVTDKTTGESLILSNNHVLANSNDALIGDAILQPGAIDGGQNPADVVATLERFVRIRFTTDPVDEEPEPTPGPGPTPPPVGGDSSCDVLSSVVAILNAAAALFGSQKRVMATTLSAQGVAMPTPTGTLSASAAVPENQVDCALARPVNPAMFNEEILQIGKVTGTKPATLGMRVRKYGRTTSYTEGNVTLLNATVNISYGSNKTARFVGQVVTEAMSQGGDSGSLIVDGIENKAVGLLYAGSELATIFNPIDKVLAQLNITI
ncbi:MAG: hypothetical protein IT319_22725 [Anaerolineae bacterium]|nr:hypothetical protein [Anaerolineae bacterium]